MNKTFFEIAAQIDEIVNLSAPTPKALEHLTSLISTKSLEQYFLRRIALNTNLAWLPYLKENGYFEKELQPVEVAGGLSFPRWPALAYLVAIAPIASADVVEIAEGIQVEHTFAMTALIQSFTKISPEFAPRVSKVVLNWLGKKLPVTQELRNLIRILDRKQSVGSSLIYYGYHPYASGTACF